MYKFNVWGNRSRSRLYENTLQIPNLNADTYRFHIKKKKSNNNVNKIQSWTISEFIVNFDDAQHDDHTKVIIANDFKWDSSSDK